MALLLQARELSSSLFSWNTAISMYERYTMSSINPLVKRIITNQWQELLMLGGVVFSVISATTAFFYGSTYLAVSFLLMGALSATGAFYMHQFACLQSLENTAYTLHRETQRLSTVATTLEGENNTLTRTNQQLQATNVSLQQTAQELRQASVKLTDTHFQLENTNRSLQTTNQKLQRTNVHLAEQVFKLTIHVSKLQESEQRIRAQTLLFQRSNQTFANELQKLNAGLRMLDQQTVSSKNVCNTLSDQMHHQQEDLGEQIRQLKEYVTELSNKNSIKERIHELSLLHNQIMNATNELHTIQLQSTEQQVRMEEIQKVWFQLRDAFKEIIKDFKTCHRDNLVQTQQLQKNVEQFSKLFIPSAVLAI